jgi:hypothetical protein
MFLDRENAREAADILTGVVPQLEKIRNGPFLSKAAAKGRSLSAPHCD